MLSIMERRCVSNSPYTCFYSHICPLYLSASPYITNSIPLRHNCPSIGIHYSIQYIYSMQAFIQKIYLGGVVASYPDSSGCRRKRVWIQLSVHALINEQNNTWSLRGVSVCSTQYHSQDLLLIWNKMRIYKVLYRTEIASKMEILPQCHTVASEIWDIKVNYCMCKQLNPGSFLCHLKELEYEARWGECPSPKSEI